MLKLSLLKMQLEENDEFLYIKNYIKKSLPNEEFLKDYRLSTMNAIKKALEFMVQSTSCSVKNIPFIYCVWSAMLC
jgi:hypothetical protein